MCQGCQPQIGVSGRWPCDRTQVPQLVNVFLPGLLFDHLTHDALEDFAQHHIAGYVDRSPLSVQLTAGFGLSLTVEAHEVYPKGNWMQFSTQFRQDNQTQKYQAVTVPSPCLVMTFVGINDVQVWRKYLKDSLERILVENFEDVPRKCFPGQKESNRIFRSIMELLYKYRDCPNKVGWVIWKAWP